MSMNSYSHCGEHGTSSCPATWTNCRANFHSRRMPSAALLRAARILAAAFGYCEDGVAPAP